jgi:hypothetical protein
MSSRRKKVEQIRQSLCVETAWANSVVSRSPRKPATSSCRGYHCIRARRAVGEWARVRFMLVTRPCAASWRSSSARAGPEASARASGSIRAMANPSGLGRRVIITPVRKKDNHG